MSNPNVSIIIVNYKTLPFVIDCITSIFEHTYGVTFEIIVVDNNSNDNCKNVLESKFGKIVKVIISDLNIGFGQANNLGFKYCSGNAILYLNPDTILMNNAIKILYEFLVLDSKIGAVGANLYDEYLNGTNSYIKYLPGLKYEIRKIIYILSMRKIFSINEDFNETDFPMQVGGITGADMMVKTNIILKTGGFDRDYFMYLEETDLCKRITDLKYCIYSVPAAKIQHLEGKSFDPKNKNSINVKKLILNEEGRRLFAKKHMNYTNRLLYNFLYLARIILINILKGNKQRRYVLYLFFYTRKKLNKKKSIWIKQ